MATIIKGKNKNRPYTVRYFHEGRQRERSFRTWREANDFKVKFEHDSRERIFVDPAKANVPFREYANGWLERHTGKPRTLEIYRTLLDKYILPAMGGKRLSSVATDREDLEKFLRVTMPDQGAGASWTRSAYMVINAVVNDAIRNGRLTQTRIRGITLPQVRNTAEFVFPAKEQISALSDAMPNGYGVSIFLMRGCGLRIGEALGVRRDDFIGANGNITLRLRRQLTPDGKEEAPLKHRDAEDYRDVPVPEYVRWRLSYVEDRDDLGHIFRNVSRRQYGDYFNRAKKAAGIEGHFTPHSLRHAFASIALAGGVPITDVSHWLGHRSIQTTFGIYGHLVPSSWDRARAALNDEWDGG